MQIADSHGRMQIADSHGRRQIADSHGRRQIADSHGRRAKMLFRQIRVFLQYSILYTSDHPCRFQVKYKDEGWGRMSCNVS